MRRKGKKTLEISIGVPRFRWQLRREFISLQKVPFTDAMVQKLMVGPKFAISWLPTKGVEGLKVAEIARIYSLFKSLSVDCL